MESVLRFVLESALDARPLESTAEWWVRHRAVTGGFAGTIEQAVAGGFASDRVGYAFASGYQSALRALDPSLPADRIASLCATERGGAHPKAIVTELRADADGSRFTLWGSKRWSTLAPSAGVLLVVASEGADGASGRKRLRIAKLSLPAEGARVEPMAVTPFAPEVLHAEITLEGARPGEVLPGDGYERYLKPFRTLEDAHVHAAVLGYLLRAARQGAWPRAFVERGLAVLAAALGVGASDPASHATQLALAGVLGEGRRLFEDAAEHWATRAEPDARARWERDAPLLAIADGVRAQRTERAWESVTAAR